MNDTTDFAEKERLREKRNSADSLSESISGTSLSPPPFQLKAHIVNTVALGDRSIQKFSTQNQFPIQRDTYRGEFADPSKQVKTNTGFTVNPPIFDPEIMRDVISGAEFQGAESEELEQAMLTLYNNPQGEQLEQALAKVAKIRGLDPTDMRRQYELAMEIRRKGEENAKAKADAKGEKYESVSPSFSEEDLKEGGRHHGFTGSTGQLRFGMVLGDVFGLDPVFGSLISPTGGAVGPGTNSISHADPNNPTVMHGVVHDAAGYFRNAHDIGPGYNYLNAYYEKDPEDPFSGQISGTGYFADRNPYLNALATGGTGIKNIPRYGFTKGNIIQSGIEAGESNIFTKAVDFPGDVWERTKGLASKAWTGTQDAIESIPQAMMVPQVYGSKPEGDGLAGAHAYLSTANKDGLAGGFGLGSFSNSDEDWNFSLGLGGTFHIGDIPDEEGGTKHGMGGSIGGFTGSVNLPQLIDRFFGEGTTPKDSIGDLDVGLGTASADFWLNPESGLSLGAQANIWEVAASIGTSGTGDRDNSVRLGISEGLGEALRLHWRDIDGDGMREFGFGIDHGMLSGDAKTEDPLRDLAIVPLLGPIGILASENLLPEENLTYLTADKISGLASDAWSGTQKLGKNVGDMAGETWEGTKGLASDAMEGAVNIGQQGMNEVQKLGKNVGDMAGEAWEGTKGLAGDAMEGAITLGQQGMNEVQKLGNNANDMVGEAWEGTKGLTSDALEGAITLGQQGMSKAQELGNTASDMAGEAWEGTKGLASDAWEEAKENASAGWEAFTSFF